MITKKSVLRSPGIVTAMNRVCGAVVVLYGVKLLIDFVMAVL